MYYTRNGKWGPNLKDGIFFSKFAQAEAVIRAARLSGAYVSAS
jgi:hypothetical protein